MTLRELLSCYDAESTARLKIYDREWHTKSLSVCFEPDGLEWMYEDDMEELDKLADLRIIKWYQDIDRLAIVLDTEF